MFGTNDALQGLVNGKWKQDYKKMIQESFIDAGYEKSKLFIAAPTDNARTDVATAEYLKNMEQVHTFVEQIAKELEIGFIDLYKETRWMILEAPYGTIYWKEKWRLGDNVHLSQTGHGLLAGMLKDAITPLPQPMPGQLRVKLFGAGSAMAGISSYRTHFEHLFSLETGRNYYNYSVFGTGLGDPSSDTTQFYYQRRHAEDGVRDISIFLYGNNDGDGSASWKQRYKQYIEEGFINKGYDKNKLVIMTITMHPGLQQENVVAWNRITAANESIRQISQELGIKLLDIQSRITALSNPENYFSDMYHINDAANRLVADWLKSSFTTISLPVKPNSLKIKSNADGSYSASFIASQTTETKEFILMYSEDGKNFRPVYHLFPEKLVAEKPYSFTFTINN